MSKYDNIPLELALDNSVTQQAIRASRVGLNCVAHGGHLDEARAKIQMACSVDATASSYAIEASTIVEAKALAHFEVNLAEAEAKAAVYLEKVAAEKAAREEEAQTEVKAHQIIQEIADVAEIQWPAIYVSSIAALHKVSTRVDILRELGVCGRPWMDSMSENLFRFKLTSISKKYMP